MMKSLSLLLADGFEPQGFIFYMPLSELFSVTEGSGAFLKQCFGDQAISGIEIFSRTNF
jgi:hypothetical protein